MSTATPEWKGSARGSPKATFDERRAGNYNCSFGFQFGRLIEYVLNFLSGDSKMEKKIFAKALKPKAASEALALVKMYG